MVVLAVDPGRDKCGLAVAEPGQVLHREVVGRAHLAARARELAERYRVQVVVLGDATTSRAVGEELAALHLPVQTVPEAGTTREARRRYFQEHPPRGLARLLPPGLRVPPRPVDDYAAVLLAERFLRGACPAPENSPGLTGAGPAP